MSKISWIFIIILLLANSCEKDDGIIVNYSPDVKFFVTSHLFAGKKIDCIETDARGNIWIASDHELYYKNGNVEKTFTLDYLILDLAIASDESLWIGTKTGGLGHLTQEGITWYNVANSGLPRDYISNVKAGPDGRIWFSSCAHDRGGLVVYDHSKFEIFTPDNSPMNQNVVSDIEIDQAGNVYISTSGKVGSTNIYRISDNSWDCLANGIYWVKDFSVGPKGSVYLILDMSLASYGPVSNSLHAYIGNKWQRIDADFISRISSAYSIKVDKRDYCWVAGFKGNSPVLRVYNGKLWKETSAGWNFSSYQSHQRIFNGKLWNESPAGIFPEDFITTIETDSDNNIWIGTAKNGVFILNQ